MQENAKNLYGSVEKSSYDSPGKKRCVTGTSDPTGGFYPNCFTVCFPGFCGKFVCVEAGPDDCDFHKGSPSFGSGTDRNDMTLLSTVWSITGYNLSPLLSLPANQDRLFRRPTCSQEGKGL